MTFKENTGRCNTINSQQRKANISAGIWLFSLFPIIGIATSDSFGANIWDGNNNLAASAFILHGLFLIMSLWHYAKAKGYPGILGIGLPPR